MSPEPVDEKVEDVKVETEETEASEESASREKLTEFEGQELLYNLMADPNVHKVLTANREGRKVQVVDEVAETEPDEIDEGLESLDNPEGKKLVELMNKKMAPLVEEVAALKEVASTYEQQTVAAQIKESQDAHKDFGKYRKSMAVLARDNPALKVPALYMLAKFNAGELKIQEPSTHSEKPTPTPRSRLAHDKKTAPKHGRRGFQSLIAGALDDLDV